jgi:hypothetical protein
MTKTSHKPEGYIQWHFRTHCYTAGLISFGNSLLQPANNGLQACISGSRMPQPGRQPPAVVVLPDSTGVACGERQVSGSPIRSGSMRDRPQGLAPLTRADRDLRARSRTVSYCPPWRGSLRPRTECFDVLRWATCVQERCHGRNPPEVTARPSQRSNDR